MCSGLMKLYSIEDGETLVRAARNTIELYLSSPKFKRSIVESYVEKFNERYGVFVTIEHYPTKALRGCIGFPTTTKSVKELLPEAAIAAATEDPRFVSVSHMEFEHMVVSVNILSKPEQIKANTIEKIKKEIKVGRDGLILRYGYNSGLFLPIVPVEQGWNVEEYLDNLCLKAQLHEHTWKTSNVELYKFTSQEFRELSPNGPIEEIMFE